jgi:hypothetical protein
MSRLAGKLNELGIHYAICGALAMFYHGFRRFTEGVDVIVTEEAKARIWAELVGHGYCVSLDNAKHLREIETGVRIRFLPGGRFPADGQSEIKFPIPPDSSIELDGVRFVTLPKLVEIKLVSGKFRNRLRDLGDVQQLTQVLDLPQEFSRQLNPSLRPLFLELWEYAQIAKTEEY